MKRISALFGFLAFTVVFTAASAQTTITYAIWDNNQLPVHEKIAEAFEAENPDIKVDIQVVPWGNYWDKLQTAVAGGQAYDVFWMNGPNFPVYASNGVLMDLQDRVTSDTLDTSVYPESLVNLYSLDGDLYGLPKDFDTIALFYNKDMFDAAGVDYPTADWTWDDLKTAAQALTTDGNWGFASTTADQSGYWNFIYENGGQVLNPAGTSVEIDQPAACDAIKYLYSFVAEGLSPDGATMTSVDPWTQLFPGGRLGMVVGGSWLASTYADAEPTIDVAPLPKETEQATIIHGLANVVWSKTQHPDEAWAFAKFLGSEQAATLLAESGTVIPAYNGFQDTWVESIPDMNLQVFMDATDYAVPYPTTTKGSEWQTKMVEVLGEVWNGNTPIDNACADAAAAANAVLGQ